MASVGALAGTVLGLAYARAIIAGLESIWIGAISTKFLAFHLTLGSLIIGLVSGFVCSLAAIFYGLRKASQQSPLANLKGQAEPTRKAKGGHQTVMLIVAGFVVLAAIGLMFLANAISATF